MARPTGFERADAINIRIPIERADRLAAERRLIQRPAANGPPPERGRRVADPGGRLQPRRPAQGFRSPSHSTEVQRSRRRDVRAPSRLLPASGTSSSMASVGSPFQPHPAAAVRTA
jgi:hypothetical protein